MDVRARCKTGRPAGADYSPMLVEHERPSAPDILSDEEAVEWDRIVQRMPADWFTAEIWPLLAAYCQHIVTCNQITAELQNVPIKLKADIKVLKGQLLLRKMLISEHRIMIIIASRLRLTPSSKDETTSANNEKARAPTIRSTYQVDHAAA